MAIPTPNRRSRLLAEINVTPFVDVMLVLLIIFMVAAPLVRHGVDVDLPKASTKHIAATEESLTVSLTADQQIYINRMQVPLEELRQRLTLILKQRANHELFFKADKSLPYGFVIRVMAELKNAGIDKLGIVTLPNDTQS